MKISKFILVKLISGTCAVEKCNAKVTGSIASNGTDANKLAGIEGNNKLDELYLCEKHYQQTKKIAIENGLNFEE